MTFTVLYAVEDGKIKVVDATLNTIGVGSVSVHNIDGIIIQLTIINQSNSNNDVAEEFVTFDLYNSTNKDSAVAGSKFAFRCGEDELYAVTDSHGRLQFKIAPPTEEKTETYVIKQMLTSESCSLLSEEYELTVEYTMVNGKIVVSNVFTNVIGEYGLKVNNHEDYRINLFFINLEKENVSDPDIEFRGIPFKVITRDKEGNNITESTEYIISQLKDNGRTPYSAKSGSDGVLEVIVQMPIISGVVRFNVQQTKSPAGYVKDTNEYEIQLEYAETNGIVSFVGANALVDCTYCLKVSNCDENSIETIFVNKRAGEPIKLESSEYEIDGDYIDRLSVGTSIQDFVESLEVDGTVEVYDSKGNKVDPKDPNVKMGTGFKIQINEAGQIIEKEIVVVGDYNGDGMISISDIAAINKYYLGLIPSSDLIDKAVDVTGDGKTSISDIAKLNKYYLGLIPELVKKQ